MLRRWLVATLFCFGLTAATAKAQNLCPSGVQSDKLVCLIPHVFGINGVAVANPNPSQPVPFQTNFLSTSMSPLSSAIARQAALLPNASPSSGITFSWDPLTKTFASSTDSLGPIFSERAETIGKHKVFFGADYQYLKFDSLDGLNLKALPVVLTQPDFTLNDGTTCSVNAPDSNPPPPSNRPSRTGDCSFIRDTIQTSNRIDLKIHKITTSLTFGITNRIDISISIPIENVRMGMFSSATIVHNEDPTTLTHAFPPTTNCKAPCFFQLFSSVGTASGIGDMTLQVKATAWEGKRAAFALGADIRVPTGDQLNFLGAGAAGVQPFLVWSYRSPFRIASHAFVGYESNGSSVLAGDITTGKKDRLPGRLTYSGGVDVWFTERLTTAFDIVGQQVFQAHRSVLTTSFAVPGKCDPGCLSPAPSTTADSLTQFTGTYNSTNASVGMKIRPWGRKLNRDKDVSPLAGLLITGNVLIKLNTGGLRSNYIPLGGISYTF
jgi:hypothetical protein